MVGYDSWVLQVARVLAKEVEAILGLVTIGSCEGMWVLERTSVGLVLARVVGERAVLAPLERGRLGWRQGGWGKRWSGGSGERRVSRQRERRVATHSTEIPFSLFKDMFVCAATERTFCVIYSNVSGIGLGTMTNHMLF